MPTRFAESAPVSDMRTLARTRGEQGIAELAKRQYGVVSREQLLNLGLESGAIGRRLRAGRLHQLHPGVYAVGHRVIPREGRWMAAVLASGPDAVLSHWSAAALWMIRPNSRERIDVTVSHRSRSSDLIRRHISQVPPDERTIEEGIPVTTVPRAILDLAATEDAETVQNLLRESEFLELSDRLSLPHLLERYPGRRGTRKVRSALDRLREEPQGRKRSPLEERFGPFLRRYRLPLPRYNDWIALGDKRVCVDCHWPEVRQIVELDGWQGHRTRTAFREDRARDRRLRVAGYSVTHITWNQLDDEPAAIAADLRVLLAPQAPTPA
ncbi:MAG TPA: type IV toxin-antitoxin system AbiEi family antitoxin domain-containing protein [Solirubrobacterales bacterium]|nr:type IV toxin-antitoxin system AbiEi family antitoxin domain-containing protein [Solirubrobacterales bacterium]